VSFFWLTEWRLFQVGGPLVGEHGRVYGRRVVLANRIAFFRVWGVWRAGLRGWAGRRDVLVNKAAFFHFLGPLVGY
jgi:hypothetical protein